MTNEIFIKQPYAVTLAKHKLNVHEMRIMFRVLEALQPDVKYGVGKGVIGKTLFGNKIVRLKTKNLLPHGSNNYASIRLALQTLKSKSFTLKGEDKDGKYERYTGLILAGRYQSSNEFVEVEIDRYLLPNFLALAKNYSKYLLEVVFNSSSPNVMKLYQYISHWKDKPVIKIMIVWLRDWLSLDNKYPKSKDIRRYILEPTIKELEAKADIYFKIKEPIKEGRKITGWTVQIFKKSITENELKIATTQEQNIKMFLEDHFKFRKSDLAKYQDILSKPELHRHIWATLQRIAKQTEKTTIKNIRTYTIKALEQEVSHL